MIWYALLNWSGFSLQHWISIHLATALQKNRALNDAALVFLYLSAHRHCSILFFAYREVECHWEKQRFNAENVCVRASDTMWKSTKHVEKSAPQITNNSVILILWMKVRRTANAMHILIHVNVRYMLVWLYIWLSYCIVMYQWTKVQFFWHTSKSTKKHFNAFNAHLTHLPLSMAAMKIRLLRWHDGRREEDKIKLKENAKRPMNEWIG